MENFEALEEPVRDYSLSIFEAMECLSDFYVASDNIFDLLLSAKVYLSIAPPADKFINKSYDYVKIILRNTEDDLTHEELLIKIEKILDEFLKFFDTESPSEFVTEVTTSRLQTNNNLNYFNNNTYNNNNDNNHLYTNMHQNIHTENKNIDNNNNNKRTEVKNNNYNLTTINNNNNNNNTTNINNITAQNNKDLSAKKDEKIGEMLNEIGNESTRIGLTKSAIEYFSKTIAYYKKNPTSLNLYILSDIFNNLAIELDKAGDHDNCYINFIHSLKIKAEIYGANSLKTAGAHHNIALVQERLGRFNSAMEHWLSCMEIKKKIYGEADLQMTFCYYNIGLVLLKTNEFHKALAQFEKVGEIYRAHADNEDVTYYNNVFAVGETHYALKDYKKSVLWLNSLNKEICVCEEKLRQVYQAQSNPRELLEDYAFQEILEIKYKCKVLLGICLSFEKNYRDAAEHLRYALNDLPLEMEDPFKFYDIALNELAKSCEAIGEIEAAFEFYKQTIEYVKGKWSQEDVMLLQKKKDNLNVQIMSRARK